MFVLYDAPSPSEKEVEEQEIKELIESGSADDAKEAQKIINEKSEKVSLFFGEPELNLKWVYDRARYIFCSSSDPEITYREELDRLASEVASDIVYALELEAFGKNRSGLKRWIKKKLRPKVKIWTEERQAMMTGFRAWNQRRKKEQEKRQKRVEKGELIKLENDLSPVYLEKDKLVEWVKEEVEAGTTRDKLFEKTMKEAMKLGRDNFDGIAMHAPLWEYVKDILENLECSEK